jgi:hypothetical protein
VELLARGNGPRVRPICRRLRDAVAAPDVRCRAGSQHREHLTFTVPAIDLAENDKAFKIAAELSRMEPSNVDVTVSGDTLIIKGEKRQEKEEKDDNYYLSERSFGSFQRSFSLPAGGRPRQDQLRDGEGRADDHSAQDRRGPATAEENRGEDRLRAACWGAAALQATRR